MGEKDSASAPDKPPAEPAPNPKPPPSTPEAPPGQGGDDSRPSLLFDAAPIGEVRTAESTPTPPKPPSQDKTTKQLYPQFWRGH